MPTQASRVYMNIWFLHSQTGSPPAGDLDEPDAAVWLDLVAPYGLDEPYDPALEEGDQEDIDEQLKRWEEWQGYARAQGRPMTTSRHVIEFMIELRLIEKRDDGVQVDWTIVSPLPNVDEILPLSPERREHEALMRWRASFGEVADTITGWVGQFRTPDAESLEIEVSIRALANQLGLDPEDARHGLAVLLDEDIRCDADPETAPVDAPLRLTVNWKLFEEWRTPYRSTSRGEDLGY